MAIIPEIGNGRPKLDFITALARKLKGVVSRVVEVEWAKFTLYFLRDRAVLKKIVPHLTDLNSRLVHVNAHFKRENAAVF